MHAIQMHIYACKFNRLCCTMMITKKQKPMFGVQKKKMIFWTDLSYGSRNLTWIQGSTGEKPILLYIRRSACPMDNPYLESKKRPWAEGGKQSPLSPEEIHSSYYHTWYGKVILGFENLPVDWLDWLPEHCESIDFERPQPKHLGLLPVNSCYTKE